MCAALHVWKLRMTNDFRFSQIFSLIYTNVHIFIEFFFKFETKWQGIRFTLQIPYQICNNKFVYDKTKYVIAPVQKSKFQFLMF